MISENPRYLAHDEFRLTYFISQNDIGVWSPIKLYHGEDKLLEDFRDIQELHRSAGFKIDKAIVMCPDGVIEDLKQLEREQA